MAKIIPGKDTQPKSQQKQKQKKPFQVVLVDIEKAAKDNMIHCVKIPLEENDLAFVALSYRWGELYETLIDTGVGYTASITSFALDDFYQLCRMMTYESDLKHIKYVWVDAICVDQQHPARRKATIYQMSNIYNRATYILAVPDLHLTYLKRLSIKNNETITESQAYIFDIYHLIRGDSSKLANLEEDFLRDSNVPNDPALRRLLLKYTDHFSYSFFNDHCHHPFYCPMRALDHICENSQVRRTSRKSLIKSDDSTFKSLHQCHEVVCPTAWFSFEPDHSTYEDTREFCDSNWKSKIVKRSIAIRQSMEFLTDLVRDWSSRVWVISECNIAKKKNNLKFWFTQLSTTENGTGFEMVKEELIFFKFDFEDSSFSRPILYTDYYDHATLGLLRSSTTKPVYIRFHCTMIRQLAQQTFLEMILLSKASSNEDRFHSILPLTEYNDKITEVRHWNITSLLSVKLKLYEIMNTKDKLLLLFWSGDYKSIHGCVLPTFATSTLSLEFDIEPLQDEITEYSQFDLNYPSAITLHQTNNIKADDEDGDEDGEEEEDDDDDLNRYYLRLKLREYYVADSQYYTDNMPEDCLDTITDSISLYNRLGIHEDSTAVIDIFDWKFC
ncbi:hypothetical protein BCR42DRAFT_444754 [Absidia repens]|uniref:Heterokaryon incompatibility domain-containing protein n=1 Tax=Absidia repens TaxID=90262 RepID=A0A1X2HDZ9_9FUNG|nr:hypothetical protein BCR42DRAFT_444754 [Absidia repens]